MREIFTENLESVFEYINSDITIAAHYYSTDIGIITSRHINFYLRRRCVIDSRQIEATRTWYSFSKNRKKNEHKEKKQVFFLRPLLLIGENNLINRPVFTGLKHFFNRSNRFKNIGPVTTLTNLSIVALQYLICRTYLSTIALL